MTDLTAPELVLVDLRADDRVDATRQLAQTLADAGRVTDLEQFLADVAARELQMATGIPGGIGLPHARSAAVTVPSLAIGRVVDGAGIDWGAEDGPANLVFLIAAPTEGEADHLQILAKLARKLVHVSFRQSLLEAPDAGAVASIVQEEVYGR
ncbi:PTS sugar transporter subunit IIA [Kineococcus rhizosphaerae]|uniref:PTS system fructose-specific IIA component n=1 Tax=Kineococcus rhizosphaerae TaxID=559628 RepID=A0A2T0RBA6_9ACTN|nr:fructose PTS transporter subunit IIA [Kineococcus rhizosphaerae]PRY18420.1 PTS system fructose-specific IIA component [Kineococcus rhizosphaerae]